MGYKDVEDAVDNGDEEDILPDVGDGDEKLDTGDNVPPGLGLNTGEIDPGIATEQGADVVRLLPRVVVGHIILTFDRRLLGMEGLVVSNPVELDMLRNCDGAKGT